MIREGIIISCMWYRYGIGWNGVLCISKLSGSRTEEGFSFRVFYFLDSVFGCGFLRGVFF